MTGNITISEARRYLTAANGDEIDAALALALDRAGTEPVGGYEIHQAIFSLRYPQDLPAPSWDETRVELRRRKLID